MTFSVVCAEAMTSKEAALVLDCGDQVQQVQERKNEGAKNLPAVTAVMKGPALTAGGQQGILFLNGFKSFTSPTPTNPQETFNSCPCPSWSLWVCVLFSEMRLKLFKVIRSECDRQLFSFVDILKYGYANSISTLF